MHNKYRTLRVHRMLRTFLQAPLIPNNLAHMAPTWQEESGGRNEMKKKKIHESLLIEFAYDSRNISILCNMQMYVWTSASGCAFVHRKIFYYAHSVRVGDGGIFPFVPNNNLNRFSLCKSMSETGSGFITMLWNYYAYFLQQFFFFFLAEFTTVSYSIEKCARTPYAPNSSIANLKVGEKKTAKYCIFREIYCVCVQFYRQK